MGSHASSSPGLATTPPDDVRAVLDGLRRIVRALRLTASAGQRAAGLSAAQLFVLQRLAEGPALSIAALARRTLTDPSSVSVVVRRLVAQGLVRRAQSEEDGRRSELSLTARGAAVLRKLPIAAQATLIDAVSALPGQERRALARSLERLAAGLGKDDAPAPLFFEDDTAEAPAARSRSNRSARDE